MWREHILFRNLTVSNNVSIWTILTWSKYLDKFGIWLVIKCSYSKYTWFQIVEKMKISMTLVALNTGVDSRSTGGLIKTERAEACREICKLVAGCGAFTPGCKYNNNGALKSLFWHVTKFSSWNLSFFILVEYVKRTPLGKNWGS